MSDMPACEYREHEGPTLVCLSPHVHAPGQIVRPSICARCVARAAGGAPRDRYSITPAEWTHDDDDLACEHRGTPLRTETCDVCGLRGVKVTIYACAVFVECSMRKYRTDGRGPAACLTCAQRRAAASP